MQREKDSADFDLERFIDMFDEALTSKDERVVNALRSLMMMTILTKSETARGIIEDKNAGPLRRLFEDMHNINRRVSTLEQELRYATRPEAQSPESYRHTLAGAMAAKIAGESALQKDWDKNLARRINSGSLLPKIKKEGK